MSVDLLETVETGRGSADFSIIWLHGLGADGHDFEAIVPELNLPAELAVRFVFPHAPHRAVTINNGMRMPAWYDIAEMDLIAKQDEQGIRASARQLEVLIAREHSRGVPSERIILAGFSQGGAVVLHGGLRYPHRLGGIMVLSSYLPLAEKLTDERSTGNQKTPIFMAHGLQDPVIPIAAAIQSKELLMKLDYQVEWHSYAMEHSVIPQEIDDISSWLTQRLR